MHFEQYHTNRVEELGILEQIAGEDEIKTTKINAIKPEYTALISEINEKFFQYHCHPDDRCSKWL